MFHFNMPWRGAAFGRVGGSITDPHLGSRAQVELPWATGGGRLSCLTARPSAAHIQAQRVWGFPALSVVPTGEDIFSIKTSGEATIHLKTFQCTCPATEMPHEARCLQQGHKISQSRANPAPRTPFPATLIMSPDMPQDVGCCGCTR